MNGKFMEEPPLFRSDVFALPSFLAKRDRWNPSTLEELLHSEMKWV